MTIKHTSEITGKSLIVVRDTTGVGIGKSISLSINNVVKCLSIISRDKIKIEYNGAIVECFLSDRFRNVYKKWN